MPTRSISARAVAGLVVVGVSAAVFWRTAYPSIAWWDSSNYSLAAATLGVASSPGSLLLTLMGWLLTRVPTSGSPAHQLDLLAGAIAATTATLVYAVATRLPRAVGDARGEPGPRGDAAVALGAALGALAFAFAATPWDYAVMFTPYGLTALFTALILWVMLRWWEHADRRDAWRWLALLGLLFGLDFSVHRSNALLMPGVLAWILVRRPRTLRSGAAWLAGLAGLTAGLAVQLLVMPIAAHTRSPLDMFEPSTWTRFWDYVSLAQVGGGFLVAVWPRNAPVWSVQVPDLLRMLRDDWLHSATPVGPLGWLPAIAAAYGLLTLVRRDRRLGAALAVVLALQAATTVLYFNIPADYFRSLHRHYLPVSVTIGVLLAFGTGAAVQWLARRRTPRPWSIPLAGAAVAAVPIAQLVGNWATHDASRRFFAAEYATTSLRTLPPRAIYFTVGDNDTFPLWYAQAVEGVRPDVRVVNLSLANAGWYVRQLVRRDPSFPISAPADTSRKVRPLGRASGAPVVIPVGRTAAALGLPAGTVVPASITVRLAPRVGTDYLPADAVLLDIVRTNAWRDPLCVSTTAGPDGLGWLAPYARLEGLHWCIVPVPGIGVDRDALRANLLERAAYRGYADPSVVIDDMSRTVGLLSLDALRSLLDAERASGDVDRCRDDARRFLAAVPPVRLGLPPRERAAIEARCGPSR